MSTPLSFCDVSARYGQPAAPQKSIEEQTGWNLGQIFLDYMQKLREQREKNAKEAEEDALMAMIDAMNASDEDKKSGKADQDTVNALANAGRAIVAQSEEIMEDGTKRVEWVDPTTTLTIQVMMSCLGDRFVFEQADKAEENSQEAEEMRKVQEERLEVTEQRGPENQSKAEGR